MKLLTLKIPEELNVRLEKFVRSGSKNKSEVVRQAVGAYLSTAGKPFEGSFSDLSQDLAGCLEGAPDLSVNRRRLERYGE